MTSPFGSHAVAMVTPMRPDGAVDVAGVSRLVGHLLAGGCETLVVAGTTGEAAMLTDGETVALVEQARAARRAGADGVLVVCPYYVKPSQAGIVAHCRAVADAADLPVMLYDVPHRTGVALSPQTVLALARHPNVVALKDARGDLVTAASLLRATSLAWYCGVDDLALPYLAVGAAVVVSVVGNVVPDLVSSLLGAVARGDLAAARAVDARLSPAVEAITAESLGAVLAKEALVRLGVIEHATVRLPLVRADAAEQAAVAAVLDTLVALPAGAGREGCA